MAMQQVMRVASFGELNMIAGDPSIRILQIIPQQWAGSVLEYRVTEWLVLWEHDAVSASHSEESE